jgi:dihydroflavonol-4-reductase
MSAPLVLVTGANGFIAGHLVRRLIARGCRVRGTVRTPAPDAPFESFIADLGTPGAFDAAVDGCDVVFHAASPYQLNVRDPQRDLVDPAVDGTLNVLRACRRASSVTRVVLTSSMAAITDEPDASRELSEADWNERSSLRRNPYYYSKVLAERAAWDFVERERPGFSLVAINPFMVIGPSFTRTLNTSNEIFVALLHGRYPALFDIAWGFTDVRDVADAHVRAAFTPEAQGRYLCAGDVADMRAVADQLRREGWDVRRKVPHWTMPSGLAKLAALTQKPGVRQYLRSHIGRRPRYTTAKIRRDLGLTFRPATESIHDTLVDLARWGHIDPPSTPR